MDRGRIEPFACVRALAVADRLFVRCRELLFFSLSPVCGRANDISKHQQSGPATALPDFDWRIRSGGGRLKSEFPVIKILIFNLVLLQVHFYCAV